MAFLSKLRRHGKLQHRIVWVDSTRGKGHVGRRFVWCAGADHTEAFAAAGLSELERQAFKRGATTETLREKLLDCYGKLERKRAEEATKAGGYGHGPRYNTPISELLDRYRETLKAEVEAREARGGRAGKSPKTAVAMESTAERFRRFLKGRGLADLRTGDLDKQLLIDWRVELGREPASRGKPLSPVSVNHHLRQFRTFLNRWLDDGDAAPYFRASAKSLLEALGSVPVDRRLPERFTPEQIRAAFGAAIDLDAQRTVKVERKKKKFQVEEKYEQRPGKKSPLLPWLAILAFTGCRRHEAEALRWEDVDLEHGAIIYRSRKTGIERRMLLVDPKDTVSPLFLEMLRAWRERAPFSTFVLPALSADERPIWPKSAWQRLEDKLCFDLRPKALRSNWVSYLVTMGRPPAVVALWAGHNIAVAARSYAAYAHASLPGHNLEEAFGVQRLLEPFARGAELEDDSSALGA